MLGRVSSPQVQQLRTLAAAAAAHHSSAPLTGPAVKLLLIQYGIAESAITPSGPKKNILKSDVMSHIARGSLRPVPIVAAPPADHVAQPIPPSAAPDAPAKGYMGSRRHVEKFTDIPLTNIRSTIAKRLSASKKSIPHAYQSVDIRADGMSALRAQLKKDGQPVSVNDLLVKAAAAALRSVPSLNVQWSEAEQAAVPLHTVDIAVAVATPTGLITPIVFGADCLGASTISAKIRELAARAKEGKLQPNEFQGGSFTISNLGMFGSVSNFTAIINPPQCAILAVGGTRHEMNGELQVEQRFTVTLCYDQRAISELDAQKFLAHLKASLDDPFVMLAEPVDPALDFDIARLL